MDFSKVVRIQLEWFMFTLDSLIDLCLLCSAWRSGQLFLAAEIEITLTQKFEIFEILRTNIFKTALQIESTCRSNYSFYQRSYGWIDVQWKFSNFVHLRERNHKRSCLFHRIPQCLWDWISLVYFVTRVFKNVCFCVQQKLIVSLKMWTKYSILQ